MQAPVFLVGVAIAAADGSIAAIAAANGFVVVTRDTTVPFEAAGAAVINPRSG